ncbi:unnamed protein product [Aureobasidium mustum]|uniref:Uncharacterized protein n=1 Tax=Aureobasidium mustum TaxID=2773714 RepID=A0A9N8PDZ0_9PEZI|nr:unnamed protein product [Aureobasidium mustum]
MLRIASACVALQKIKVDGACDIPCEESDLRLDMRIATAAGLSELPKSIRSLELSWSSPGSYEIPEVRSLNESTEQDLLCIALHKVSLQLQDLVIFDMAVFPELFCPDGLPGSAEVYWPNLETLDLDQIDDVSPSGALSRYGDGSSSEEVLIKHYIDDLYTSLGYATQRMPRLKNAKVELRSIDHELKVLFRNGQWILRVRVNKHYTPSSRFLEAWRVPGGCLQPCKGRGWQQASYTTWPPQ